MDITPTIPKGKNIIHSYGNQGFKINETIYSKSIMLNCDELLEIDFLSLKELQSSISDLLKLNNDKIINSQSEILLIGTGNSHKQLSESFKEEIKKLYPAIAINEMSSAAACRTYNILIAEDRNIAAILIPTPYSSTT